MIYTEIEKELKVLLNIELAKKIEKMKKVSQTKEVVFLCVGNSKIWYDSFGPMMGSLFQYLGVTNYVYGNIRSNIDKNNLQEYIDIIYKYHNNPYIVVFDNALSSVEEFSIKINEIAVQCAKLSDNPIEVGDMSVLCLVPQRTINKPASYVKMLKEIKNFVRYVKEFYL